MYQLKLFNNWQQEIASIGINAKNVEKKDI